MRGCPVCLREDAEGHKGPGPAGMVMRGDWQMREAVSCVRHRHPLVPLWKAEGPRDRYDFAARLGEIEEDVRKGTLDQPETPPTDYDLWLDGRIEDGRDETWFKEQPLFAATTFCRLLGQAILSDDVGGEESNTGGAHAVGFEIAREGAPSIRNALDRIARAANGPLDEPNKAFGPLYAGIRDYADEEGFAPYVSILRTCILDHWPVAPGEVVLGEVVTERRLHSLVTASRETGVGPSVIEQFLVEVGALPERDGRPPNRRLFDARANAALLAELPTLVGPIAMREAMGATRQELVALEEEEILVPRTRVPKVKNPWRASDGTALVTELQAHGVPVSEEDAGWESLLRARKRSGVRLADMIAAIREGRSDRAAGRRLRVPRNCRPKARRGWPSARDKDRAVQLARR